MLNCFLLPMLQTMMSERPVQPHSFIVDYIKRECTGTARISSARRALHDKSFQEYKDQVLDPTITPLMAELFETKPERPRRTIYCHAKSKLCESKTAYIADLDEIYLFDEIVEALKTQQFDLLNRAIKKVMKNGYLQKENVVLLRAIKTQRKGERLRAKAMMRYLNSLRQAIQEVDALLVKLPDAEPQEQVKLLNSLKCKLSMTIATAHRKGISDDDTEMRLALNKIIEIDAAFRKVQSFVKNQHQQEALHSLSRAIEAVQNKKPRAYLMLNFSLQRAKTLKCSPDSALILQAEALCASKDKMEEMEYIEHEQQFTFGLVGKIKTKLGRQVRHAKFKLEQERAAQKEMDDKLAESDEDFYRAMGCIDIDSESESDENESDNIRELRSEHLGYINGSQVNIV